MNENKTMAETARASLYDGQHLRYKQRNTI